MEESSQHITPPRSRIVATFICIWTFILGWAKWIWEWAKWIWGWAERIKHNILYEQVKKLPTTHRLQNHQIEKFYVYMRFFLRHFYLTPWVILLIWYLTVCLGCTNSITRPHLRGICLRPYIDPNAGLPWWLDFWNTSAENDNFPDKLSLSNEALMIGYMDIHDAVAVLRVQVSEFDNLRCTECAVLLKYLRKLLALIACLIIS